MNQGALDQSQSDVLTTPVQEAPERFLDPAVDLTPFQQSIVDQVSKQSAPKRDVLRPYMEKAKQGMDSMAILKESYANREKAMIEQAAAVVTQSQGQGADVVQAPQSVGHGLGAPEVPAVPLDPATGAIGTPAVEGEAKPSAAKAGQVEYQPIHTEDFERAQRTFFKIIDSRPAMGDIPELKQPGIEALGLALLFSAIDRQHAPDYFAMPFQAQIQQRQDSIQKIVQKYQLDQNDWNHAATIARQVMDIEGDRLDRQTKARADAEEFNAGEQTKIGIAEIGAEKARDANASREKIAGMRIQAQKDLQSSGDKEALTAKAWEDWKGGRISEEERDAYVSAIHSGDPNKPALTKANTSLSEARKRLADYHVDTYLPETLRIKANQSAVEIAKLEAFIQNSGFQNALQAYRTGIELSKIQQDSVRDAQKQYDEKIGNLNSQNADNRKHLQKLSLEIAQAQADVAVDKTWKAKLDALEKERVATEGLIQTNDRAIEFLQAQRQEIGKMAPAVPVFTPPHNAQPNVAVPQPYSAPTGSRGMQFLGKSAQDEASTNPALRNEVGGIANSLGMTLGVTTANTGHRDLTTSGNPSRHKVGNAVDVTSINGHDVKTAKGGQLADQLVEALKAAGYAHNTESGHDRAVLWRTNVGGNHHNHLHISNRLSQGNRSERRKAGNHYK